MVLFGGLFLLLRSDNLGGLTAGGRQLLAVAKGQDESGDGETDAEEDDPTNVVVDEFVHCLEF